MRAKRDVRLAAALDDRDRLAVDVVPERREHERGHELLGQARPPLSATAWGHSGAGERRIYGALLDARAGGSPPGSDVTAQACVGG
jgi:hypothetical protein